MVSELTTSVKDFQSDDWLAPVYKFQESLIELTSIFSDCQTTNSAKQLMTRTSSLGGFFELFGTVGAAIVKNSRNEGTSTLYTSYKALGSSPNCASQATNFAIVLSNMLNFEAPDEVFYEDLEFNLLDHIQEK